MAIETLAVRGAPAIGVAAAYGAALARPDEFARAVARLRATRPTAVNLGWALDQVEAAGPSGALAVARELAAREQRATELIAAHGAELFSEPGRLMTHCNAGALAATGVGTALGVVRAAFAAGHVESVWVPETRPLLQGARLTAWELAAEGIPHRVVTDSSAGPAHGARRRRRGGGRRRPDRRQRRRRQQDRHLSAGRPGRAPRVPFYVAAPQSTIDPACATGADIPIEERSADELAAPGGAPAANWAFDVTPHDLVTAIVTEEGVFRPPYAFG